MRDLQANNKIDVRFKRSEDNTSDIMTKHATRDIHEKHTNNIRGGTLVCQKEDVKLDHPEGQWTDKQTAKCTQNTTTSSTNHSTTGPDSTNVRANSRQDDPLKSAKRKPSSSQVTTRYSLGPKLGNIIGPKIGKLFGPG